MEWDHAEYRPVLDTGSGSAQQNVLKYQADLRDRLAVDSPSSSAVRDWGGLHEMLGWARLASLCHLGGDRTQSP